MPTIHSSFRSTLLCGLSLGVFLVGCSQAEEKDVVKSVESPQVARAESQADPETNQPNAEAVVEDVTSVRSADSHVHGGAVISIVSENDIVQIELETPLYNLLGFEYEPESEAETSLVSKVEADLAEPQNLIRFNERAGCAFDAPVSKISLFDAHSDDDHDEDHHDHEEKYDHDHSDHHKTEAEAEGHDHDQHHEHEGDESHKDVILTYSLTCQDIDKLELVEVEFFETFPNLAELELVYLGPSQQMSDNLTPSKTTADLTR